MRSSFDSVMRIGCCLPVEGLTPLDWSGLMGALLSALPCYSVIRSCTATPNFPFGNLSTRITCATYSRFIGSCGELYGHVTNARIPG